MKLQSDIRNNIQIILDIKFYLVEGEFWQKLDVSEAKTCLLPFVYLANVDVIIFRFCVGYQILVKFGWRSHQKIRSSQRNKSVTS